MAPEDERLAVVECRVAPEDSALITELLSAQGVDFYCERNRETGQCVMRVYGAVADRDALLGQVRNLFHECRDLFSGEPPELTTALLHREDWSEVWKRHFHKEDTYSNFTVVLSDLGFDLCVITED